MITQEMYDETVAELTTELARLENYIRDQNIKLIPAMRLLNYLIEDVHGNYDKLTYTEQNLISYEEFQKVLSLISKVTG